MLKLQTRVECGAAPFRMSYSDGIVLLVSCFADDVGSRMADAGFDVCTNPFGTLYNPVSICQCEELLYISCRSILRWRHVPFTSKIRIFRNSDSETVSGL